MVVSSMDWFVADMWLDTLWISVWVKVWLKREGEGDLSYVKRKYEDLRFTGHLLHNRGEHWLLLISLLFSLEGMGVLRLFGF